MLRPSYNQLIDKANENAYDSIYLGSVLLSKCPHMKMVFKEWKHEKT